MSTSMLTQTAIQPSHARQTLLWLMWLVLFLALSYKKKILGEAALRPLYLLGVAYGCVLLLILGHRARQFALQWRSIGEATTFGLITAVCGYIFIQSLLYPASFNDVTYTVATTVLVLGVSAFSMLAHGWEATAIAVFRALLNYSLLNIALLVLSFAHPPAVSGILVPPLESGYGARISGLPGDPTHLGSLFAVTLLLMFLLRERLRGRMIWPALLILGFLIVTGSRNAVLSLLIGCTVASLAEARFAPMILRTMLVLALLLAAAAAVIAVDSDALAYVGTLFRVDDPNAYSRFDIWRDMADIVGQMSWFERLFGGGYLYIQAVYGSPYNAFLRIFFGHGLFVCLCFIAITITLFLYAGSERTLLRRQLALGLLTYWFTFSMFLDTAFAEFFHFTEFCLWLGAALVLTRSLRLRDPAGGEPGTEAVRAA